MEHKIKVIVIGKIAVAEPVDYVCGNSDYVLSFDFDEEWSEFEHKTARFTFNGKYEDVVFSGNECPVPIISNTHSIFVGVFAGDLCTTTPAYIPAKKSILCGNPAPADPTPDVYNQIMALLNDLKEVSKEEVEKAVLAYMADNPLIDEDDLEGIWNALRTKVQLPFNKDEVPDYGKIGQFAVSDGKGGVAWEDKKPAADCYTTERVKLTSADGSEVGKTDVNANYILGLYEELMTAHPKMVKKYKVISDDATFTNTVYTISTGEYNTAGERGDRDADIKKPKYMILTCIHGNEKKAAISTYRFIKDLLEKKNVPSQFREGAVFHIMPVANPYGVNNSTRYNEAGVDLNRNFDYKWSAESVGGRNPGNSPGSEKETQTIMNWLKANTDADLFIDFHNSTSDGKDEKGNTIWVTNEVAMVVGLNTEEIKSAKQTALRGLDRIIPHWRYEIGYTANNVNQSVEEIKEPVFSYSSFYDIPGASVYYAADKLGIPSLTLECSSWQNMNVNDVNLAYPFFPETIAAGAEALGNILLEFYKQTNTEIDQKKITHNALVSLMSISYNKYNTIEDALAETNAAANGKVGTYTDKNGVYNLVLLDDISSAVAIAVTRDCNIQLNGHTISFTASNAYLDVKTASAVSIDGTVLGSKIVNCDITSSVDEQAVKVTDTHLTIIGGTYALENVNCKSARVIRSATTTTQIDMIGCTVTASGKGTGTMYAGSFGNGELVNCKYIVDANSTKVQGVSAYGKVTMTNCVVNAKTNEQGYTVAGVKANSNTTLTLVNCNITADGYGGNIATAITDGIGSTVNIIGGQYKGARDALSITNKARVDGGLFEGCRNGGGNLTGSDIKIKNAIFRNIPYFGDTEWSADRLRACLLGDSDGANVTFDGCSFGADGVEVSGGLVCDGTDAKAYISNSNIDAVFTLDLSAASGNTIYVGQNVKYRADKVDGNIDTKTHAGKSFAWEWEG